MSENFKYQSKNDKTDTKNNNNNKNADPDAHLKEKETQTLREEFDDGHQTHNREHINYIKKQVQLVKTGMFFETTLNNLYSQQEILTYDNKTTNNHHASFCSSKWQIVKEISRIGDLKELIMSKMVIDNFKMFENDDWVVFITLKD